MTCLVPVQFQAPLRSAEDRVTPSQRQIMPPPTAWYTTGAPEITFTGSGNSVTVNVGWGTTNSTNICVTPSNSCGNGSTRCQFVNIVAPPSVGQISGPTTVCKGKSGVVFSVPNQPGVTYSWSYSGSGFNIVSGQGTNSITANFSMTATPGVLSVTVSNACGSASSSKNITILIPRWLIAYANCGNSNCTPFIWDPPSYSHHVLVTSRDTDRLMESAIGTAL
jgi:hypothetical protein